MPVTAPNAMSLLNQVLTFFSGDNGLRLDIELQHESVEHVNGFPWMLEFNQRQRGL